MVSFLGDAAILESNVSLNDSDLAIDLTEVMSKLSLYPLALRNRAIGAISAARARIWQPGSQLAPNTGLAGIEYQDGFKIVYNVFERRFIVSDIDTGVGPEAGRSRSGSFVRRNGSFIFYPHPKKGNAPNAWIEGGGADVWHLVLFPLGSDTIMAVPDGASDPTRIESSADVTPVHGAVTLRIEHGCISVTEPAATPGMTLSFTRAGTPLRHGPGARWKDHGYRDLIQLLRLFSSSGDLDLRHLSAAPSFDGGKLFADWLDDDGRDHPGREFFLSTSRPAPTLATGYTVHSVDNDGLTQDWCWSGDQVDERSVGGLPLHGLSSPTGEAATNIAPPHACLVQTAPSTSLRSEMPVTLQ